jgi:hypothetical protein
MKTRFDLVVIVSAICVAGYVAFALGYLAIYDFGLSRVVVRSGSIIAATLIAATLAIEYFGKKLGNTR